MKMKSYKKSVSMSNSLDELYSEYKNRIMGKARYLRSKDIDVREYSILPEDKFKAIFKRYRISDKKISAGRIIDNVVSKQLNHFSAKQARPLLQEALKKGEKTSLVDIMYGQDIVNAIKDAYAKMRSSGLTSTEARRKISQSFFGSP